MTRIARQILVLSLLSLHGAATLCGPAHHSSHRSHDGVTDADRSEHGSITAIEANCPVCHSLAQG